jgi:hypothetical protein
MRTAQALLAMLAAHHAPQATKQITLAFQMAFQPKNKTRLSFLNHKVALPVQITPAHHFNIYRRPRTSFFVPQIQ